MEQESYIEIECPVESNGKLKVIEEVQKQLAQTLRCQTNGKSRMQPSEESRRTDGIAWIRCLGKNATRWEPIKKILHEKGLLDDAVVYHHHPALKCRMQIWP